MQHSSPGPETMTAFATRLLPRHCHGHRYSGYIPGPRTVGDFPLKAGPIRPYEGVTTYNFLQGTHVRARFGNLPYQHPHLLSSKFRTAVAQDRGVEGHGRPVIRRAFMQPGIYGRGHVGPEAGAHPGEAATSQKWPEN